MRLLGHCHGSLSPGVKGMLCGDTGEAEPSFDCEILDHRPASKIISS